MSISRNLHLGPYVECNRKRTKERPDVMDLTGEALCEVEVRHPCALAIANVRRPGEPGDVMDDASFAEDLRGRDMAAEVAWFESAFAPELAKIREAFASVEVKWGLLQWFS